jgi:alkyldihydroxyacetonephosphate synthase
MTRSWWGWGDEEKHLNAATVDGLAQVVAGMLGGPPPTPVEIRDVASLVPTPRVALPDALSDLGSTAPLDRVRHARGNSYRDVVRALHGELPGYPDLVVRPHTDDDVERLLAWAAEADIACVPFGGGSSVVGGVTGGGVTGGDLPRPVAAMDLEHLAGVTEVDAVSRAAYVRGGTYGPAINDALRPHDLTLRFFPQSWEFSTMGGWAATRAGGHFATGPTHIDDLIESVDAITPAGRWSSRRLPASGAGPSPDRLLLGSEGAFGVITGAWVRVQARPTFRASATVSFQDLHAGLDALRAITQSGLQPSNARLLDAAEAALNGAGDGSHAVLALGYEGAGFEGTDHPLGPVLAHTLELCRDHGGTVTDGPHIRTGDTPGEASGGAGAWRASFLAAPYLRDALVRLGVIVETFETATTWDRVHDLVEDVPRAARDAATQLCGSASVSVRVTHAYVDGCAPYVTVLAPGVRGQEVDRWDAIKTAASEAILAGGGTITHHHAVGRDHAPWYGRQVPPLHTAAMTAVKATLDPTGIMNPGVLGLA